MKNHIKEIERRDKKIADDKKTIIALKEEVTALKQLLDCAAANIVLLVKEGGSVRKISRESVRVVLGQYHLSARCDDAGNYLLEAVAKKE